MTAFPPKKILVAVDASARAQGVLVAARGIALGTSAEVVLFRSVGIPIEVPPEAFGMSPDQLPQILEAKARYSLEEAAKTHLSGVTYKIDVRLGTPWESIVHMAQEENVDLIVIGSHGYSGIDRILGTTASRVVNHADRSVLVVREKKS